MQTCPVFVLLQEQDSSYTIIKSKELEMVVMGLKPSTLYIFQVHQNPPPLHRPRT